MYLKSKSLNSINIKIAPIALLGDYMDFEEMEEGEETKTDTSKEWDADYIGSEFDQEELDDDLA